MIKYYYENADRLIGSDFEARLKTISTQRQKRVASYKRDEDKRLCLAATLLLDKALAEYGLSEKNMRYAMNEYKKPYFENYENLHFNLSHSGNYAAAVLSDSEVGCDIQKKENVDIRIAERFFSAGEAEYVRNTDDFFRIWALKESFIKAVGRGLSIPIHSFCIENLDSNPYVLFENEMYSFIEKSIDGYNIAVCKRLRTLDS